MATPKTPQDHKPKAVLAEGDLQVEVQGHTWTIRAEVRDDWELAEKLSDPTGKHAIEGVRDLLGEQYDEAKETVRDPQTGRVSVTGMITLTKDIMSAVGSGNR